MAEKECVGCTERRDIGFVSEWDRNPDCPVHGDEALRATQRAMAAEARPVVEGTVIEPDRRPVTLMELTTGLMTFVQENPRLAQLPVSFQTHCCVMNLSGEEPEVVAGVDSTVPELASTGYVLIKLEDV